jgi:hypothetical protein
MKRLFAAIALGTVLAVPSAFAAEVAAKNSGQPVAGARLSLDPFKGKFHQVHTQKVKASCETCHATELKDVLFLRGAEVAASGPGPVDRSICLGCHQAPSKPTWYGAPK